MKSSRRLSSFSRFMAPGKSNRPLKREPIPLLLEGLEDRMAPAVYNVTGVADGAGMITPTGPGTFDASTLRAAVVAADASADAANTINVPAGNFSLTSTPSELDITNNVTIQGAGANVTSIDGAQNGRVFFITMGTIVPTVTIAGLTIDNGKAPQGGLPGIGGPNDAFGGGIANEGSLTLTNVIVTRNSVQGAVVGGAGSISGGKGDGGGIYNHKGTLVIQNSTISNNQATGGNADGAGTPYGGEAAGGGIYSYAIAPGSVILTNSTISGNVATGGNGTQFPNGKGYGGRAYGGGVASNSSTPTITNTSFSGNQAKGGSASGGYGSRGGEAFGGGLFDFSYGAQTIQGSNFSGNQAIGGVGSNPAGVNGGASFLVVGGEAGGGAISNHGAKLSISGSTLTGNSATGGAAIGGGTKPTGGTASGGGILNALSEGGTITMTSCTLSGNLAAGGAGTQTNFQEGFGGLAYGGGFANQSNYAMTITDTTFSANQVTGGNGMGDYGGAGAFAKGGGVYTLNGQMTIQDSTFSGNLATGGAGSNTVAYFTGSIYSVKGGYAAGAAIATNGTKLSISNSTLNGNNALGGTASTVNPAGYGNGGGAYGGGIYAGPGRVAPVVLLTNSTLDFNQARGGTGGSANLNGSGAGGGVYISIKNALAATLESTIVANDAVFGGFGPDVFGSFVSNGFNLIGSIDATAQGFTNGVNSDQVGTVASPINPILGQLANHGGPTQTQALQMGSPALDKGANPNNLVDDQRGPGFPRTVGAGTDVGAFEAQLTQISGFVYDDANDNGLFDKGENGVPGVTITLTGFDFKGKPVSLTTNTLADGSFVFANLQPSSEGGYKVTRTPPAGFFEGQASVPSGEPGFVQSNDVISVALPFGFTFSNYDFGELLPSSLGGFVYIDANKNGKFDPGEKGFAGATVALTGSNDLTNPINLQTQTDAGGAYNFANLRPGVYTITLTPPTGNFLRGANTQGTPGNGTPGANSFNNITLVQGVLGANNDFAEISLAGTIEEGAIPVSATENLPFTAPVASFIDTDGDPVGNFTATIKWGDGTQSLGVVTVGAAGGFVVTGTHTYALKGVDAITVVINDIDTSSSFAGSLNTVVDAALSLTPTSFRAFETIQENNLTVASFTDAGGLRPAGEYTATINWGDGTPATNGRIVIVGNAARVVGDHKYAIEGFYTVRTTVTDIGGQSGPGIANATATKNLQVLVGGYVTSLYGVVLNRLADPPGLTGWVQQLQNGATRAQVAEAFWVSPEHRGIEVDQLYVLILHRPSDAAGRGVWVAQLLSGMSENQIAIQFLVSPEYTAGHASISAFVNGLYSDVLARSADSLGLSYWTQILQNGARTRAAVAYYFLSSGEALTDAIGSYFEDFLSRAPDAMGLNELVLALESGKSSTAEIVGIILGSPEYAALILARAMA